MVLRLQRLDFRTVVNHSYSVIHVEIIFCKKHTIKFDFMLLIAPLNVSSQKKSSLTGVTFENAVLGEKHLFGSQAYGDFKKLLILTRQGGWIQCPSIIFARWGRRRATTVCMGSRRWRWILHTDVSRLCYTMNHTN